LKDVLHNHALRKLDLDFKSSLLVDAVIDALVEYANDKDGAGLSDATPILFTDPALQGITIGDVKHHYRSLFGR
jgi:hypothetical protein